ncbi:hypothetical protein [Mycobacterium hubeiense]|uniref:hypothetical protein n=1 Tax=Mycobacterium hubeiense TaxID=1867256 RepID=UPI000C7EC502|nr:hypothetical protein [Mycobacterium sp. QGD 101]
MTVYEILTIALIGVLAAAATTAIWLGLVRWAGQCGPAGHEWALRAQQLQERMPRSHTHHAV